MNKESVSNLRSVFRFLMFFTSISIICCQQEKSRDTLRARAFYDSLHQYTASNREMQQRLINRTAETLLTIKNDAYADIDVKGLHLLLDSALRSNKEVEQKIERLTEVDNEIDYKKKTLEYIRLFNNLYEREMKNYLLLLSLKGEDRYEKGAALMLPRLKEIKEKEEVYKAAQETFLARYPVEPDGSIRSAPDYELVKTSELKFRRADVKEGETVSLISYSGGVDCEEDKIYYYQYIVVHDATGDTIRILMPCFPYDIEHPVRSGKVVAVLGGEPVNKISTSYVVFNKHQASLEKKDLKTIFGVVKFDGQTSE